MADSTTTLFRDTDVLVTGATGFTGSVLVRRLCEAGARVRAIARASSNLDALKDLPIQWFRGDVFDEAVVRPAAEGVRYIFHMATVYRKAGSSDDLNYKVHVVGTQLLAECAAVNPNLRRFVHVSTVGVHGHVENPPADEDYPMAPGDEYQETKAEAERWFKQFATQNKLPFSIIRPAAIYGPTDRRLLKLFKLAARKSVLLLGDGSCSYHFIHVDDLCAAMMKAATHPGGLDETFIVGNPVTTRLDDFARIVGKVYGWEPRIIRIPAAPFFLLAAVCETLCKPFGIDPPLHKRRVAFFTKNRSFNTSRLRTKLEFQYQHTTEEGVMSTARWYIDQGWLPKPTT